VRHMYKKKDREGFGDVEKKKEATQLLPREKGCKQFRKDIRFLAWTGR